MTDQFIRILAFLAGMLFMGAVLTLMERNKND